MGQPTGCFLGTAPFVHPLLSSDMFLSALLQARSREHGAAGWVFAGTGSAFAGASPGGFGSHVSQGVALNVVAS